jgi:hypothetical protein
MTNRTRKLSLVTGSRIVLEGEGDDLHIKLRAHRKKRTGDYEFFEIDLSVGRWLVQQLGRQIATMHARDRERLAREAARIDREIQAIQQPETP